MSTKVDVNNKIVRYLLDRYHELIYFLETYYPEEFDEFEGYYKKLKNKPKKAGQFQCPVYLDWYDDIHTDDENILCVECEEPASVICDYMGNVCIDCCEECYECSKSE